MSNLQFIKRLYRGKNCYSDALTEEELEMLNLPTGSGATSIVENMIRERRIVFLTGNPGDGKTFIIRTIQAKYPNTYVISDLNSITEEQLDGVIEQLVECYTHQAPCIVAANEYPLLSLMRKLSSVARDFYEELMRIKQNTVVLDCSNLKLSRICVIDLNDRNLLANEYGVVESIINKFVYLLQDSLGSNAKLDYNIKALSDSLVQQQIISIFNMIALTGEHIAIRDILGTIAYTITACTFIDGENAEFNYYDAFFSGDNDLMDIASSFDPVLLSSPSLDEQLWNGELLDGWRLGIPEEWPFCVENNVEHAVTLFRSIKRKFYFENELSSQLCDIQPSSYSECEDIFKNLETKSRRIKQRLVRSLNKLFFSSDTECEKLRVWTTHGFDLSRESGAAVSTRFIDIAELELILPKPIAWLSRIEYTPAFIALRHIKKPEKSVLKIELDMLKVLIAIEKGYPIPLISTQFEYKLMRFLQTLCSQKCAKDYNDGMILMTNRREGTSKAIIIDNDKYEWEVE